MSGCGHGDDASFRPVKPLTQERTPTPPRTPALAHYEGLDDPSNLLSEDPTPDVPPDALDGGILQLATLEVLPRRYTAITENTTAVSEVEAYVGEHVARRHINDPTKWAPMLARRVHVDASGRRYTVHLRRSARWQRPPDASWVPSWLREIDPPPVTAHDFAFALHLIQDTRLAEAAPVRSWYSLCTGIRVIDDYTFELSWREGGLAAEIWTMALAPLPEHIFGHTRDGAKLANPARELPRHWYRAPVGSGPFRAQGEPLESSLELERNPDYDGVLPALAGVRFVALEAEEALAALERGDVDVALIPPRVAADGRALRRPPAAGVRIERLPLLSYAFIAWNTQRGPTADPRVRRALTMALDRQRIVDEVAAGFGRVRSGPEASFSPFSDPSIAPLPFDPAAAADLLREAGWVDTDGDGVRESGERRAALELRLLWSGSPQPHVSDAAWRHVLDGYAAQLATIGVRLVIEPLTLELRTTGLHHTDYSGLLGGWGHDWEDDPHQLWHSSQADIAESSNFGGYRSARADALIERIRVESDVARRVELHHALHATLHEDQPYTFIYEPDLLLAISPRVRGVRFQFAWPQDLALGWWLAWDMP